MSNLNKIKLGGKIQKIPNWSDNPNWLMEAKFPKHIWISKKENKHIINYYKDPKFDCPNLNYPDYHMPYEGEFDTSKKLCHQLAHMLQKSWFTAKVAKEVMKVSQLLHKKINQNKDLFWWSYNSNEIKIYDINGKEING